jgi:hypothetical protein
MFRMPLIAVALVGLACARDRGPATPTVSKDAGYTTVAARRARGEPIL